MSDINFVKVSGSGNDFIVIDNRNGQLQALSPSAGSGSLEGSRLAPKRSALRRAESRDSQLSDFVKEVCQRKTSVGADGVLVLERSKSCDVKMRIFNPDGTEVEMCGNGARCVALYLSSKPQALRQAQGPSKGPERSRGTPRSKPKSKRVNIETKAGKLEAEVVGEDRVRLKMSEPKDLRLNFGLTVDERRLEVSYINTGVPHVACFVDDLEGLNVKRMGGLIRYHPEFQPEGTNADFVRVIDGGTIKVRTYERGVEDETLSCGTGAVASAIISTWAKLVRPPVLVETRGGSRFKVYFDLDRDLIKDVYLEGEARIIYEGKIKTDN